MSPSPTIVERSHRHGDRVALIEGDRQVTHAELVQRSHRVAARLLGGHDDLAQSTVAYCFAAGSRYVAAQWGIWRAGGMATPLSLAATLPEWRYALTDSAAKQLVVDASLADRLEPLADELSIEMIVVDDVLLSDDSLDDTVLPQVSDDRAAMMLYTSGTTSKPKGVVSTHANVTSQIESLIQAWGWQPDDSIPLFLPLHHIHGIINILSCGLWIGGTVDCYPSFQRDEILEHVIAGRYSVFMAVPTIYVKLIEFLEAADADHRKAITDGFAAMRLMVSGSAALPASVHQQWSELTGQKLLERYGMTEIGMALSNPLDGERRPGAVGLPLPGVEVRLVNEDRAVVTEESVPGEIQIRGPAVFREYWNRPEATAESFEDGWFRSGDIAVVEQGYYRIMGRSSVDIIKSGGYKLSALEIEASLLDHPSIKECAVVGVTDETWGEAVAAAVVLESGESLDRDQLREWCDGKISRYKTPQQLKVVEQLPRNAMGKVTKPAVGKLFD